MTDAASELITAAQTPSRFDGDISVHALPDGTLGLARRSFCELTMPAAAPPRSVDSVVFNPAFMPSMTTCWETNVVGPQPFSGGDDFLLGHHRTRLSAGGFFEQDAQIWTQDGVLLAQARQLMALLDRRR